MRGSLSSHIISIRILHYCRVYLPSVPIISLSFSSSLARGFIFTENTSHFNQCSSFVSLAQSIKSGGGRGRRSDIRNEGERWRGRCGGSSGGSEDKMDTLGRLLACILRHMASELNLNMRSDGYVKVLDLLKLIMKTFAQVPLRSHTIDDIRQAVRKDNEQRFSLLEEKGELVICANQGHTVTVIYPCHVEVPVCVHGTYKNLDSILESGLNCVKRLHDHFSCGMPTDGEVIIGMRRDVIVLIFLDVRKAQEDGIKLYISDNRVILTEGYDGVVPIKYFEKIES